MITGGSYDAVIAGSGIAGLTAAATLVEWGRSVLVVEKAPVLGGSTRMSGGTVWTGASMAVMDQYVPGGDRAKQQHLVEGIEEGLAWLRSRGVEMGDVRRSSERIVAQVHPDSLIDRLATRVTAGGGEVAVSTSLTGVDTDGTGSVTGAQLSSGGGTWMVPTPMSVLATGGFQGSPDLLSRHVPGHTDRLLLRSNPHSTGDGLRVALAAGGHTSADMTSFYGHTMPLTSAPLSPERWTSVTPYYSQDAVMVDTTGERFFDESLSSADERAPMALVRRPQARGALVFDSALYRDIDLPGRSRARVGSTFEAAAAAGAPTVVADSLEDLAEAVTGWGMDGTRLLATLDAYNEAVRDDRTTELVPARSRHPIPVVDPPFRAMAVRPAITFTLGGIEVDDRYRVRSHQGGVIPGLHAVGADAGGVYAGGYAGGLVLGLAQGRRLAGELAAA